LVDQEEQKKSKREAAAKAFLKRGNSSGMAINKVNAD
jgi:hypothetical protein